MAQRGTFFYLIPGTEVNCQYQHLWADIKPSAGLAPWEVLWEGPSCLLWLLGVTSVPGATSASVFSLYLNLPVTRTRVAAFRATG